MARFLAVVALAVFVTACRPRSQALDTRPDADVVAVTAPTAAASTVPSRNGYSEALFIGGALSICQDVEASRFAAQPESRDAGAGDAWQPIDGACTDSFHDRLEFASCTVAITNAEAGRSATLVFRYYDIALIADSDRALQDCLKNHGKWKAMDRSSLEWQTAELEARRKKLEKSLGH